MNLSYTKVNHRSRRASLLLPAPGPSGRRLRFATSNTHHMVVIEFTDGATQGNLYLHRSHPANPIIIPHDPEFLQLAMYLCYRKGKGNKFCAVSCSHPYYNTADRVTRYVVPFFESRLRGAVENFTHLQPHRSRSVLNSHPVSSNNRSAGLHD